MVVTTQDGALRTMTAQVCSMGQNLMGVRRVCAAGNRVVFDPRCSVIQNLRTGAITPVHRADGVYQVAMWVKDQKAYMEEEGWRQQGEAEGGAGFTGQGR